MEEDVKKKILLSVTIIYFLMLLIVPCYMIYNYYDVLSNGETYKIEVGAVDPYDPFRGRYVTIRPTLPDLTWGAESVQLLKDEDDFVIGVQKTNDSNALGYVENLTIDRYYMNEKTAPLVEERQRKAASDGDSIYVVIKVKNGKYAIEGLYINDIAAEDYVK